ncbi:sulfate transporter CysZ [Arhodomonas aquaeolei]|uniref:sulfate transporter CysZ n=1 Tax=Arhodomonas aquaeolei TaxID=2369 RepID=UPI00036F15EC|nr:sulfate transporter CysZ [Arhodomonas aquaeolei]
MIRDFLRGVSYVPRGFALLGEPGLRRFVALPVIINALIFLGLFWLGAEYYGMLLNYLLPDTAALGDGWIGDVLTVFVVLLRWLLWPLFILAAAVVMFYTFTAVANLVGSPFNGMLAARVEARATGRMPPEVSSGGLVVETVGALGDELRKIAHFALLAVPLLVLFFIPVVNILAPPAWAVFGAWMMALEYCDYPLGNHGLAFADQRALLRRRRWLHLGLGGALLAMTLIPVLNLLAMPTGVIAATLLRSELGEYGDAPAAQPPAAR